MNTTETLTELSNSISRIDIANLVLTIITIMFSLPTLILVLIGIIRKYQLISVRIEGCDIRHTDNYYVLCINVDNRLDHSISITKIEINNRRCLVEINNKFQDVDFSIDAYLSKKVKILASNIKPEEKIKIKVFTSYRKKPYSISINSLIDLLNKEK